MKPFGGDDSGGLHGEQVTLDPAVIADGDGLGQARTFQIIAKALGGPADDVDVHAVCARTNDTPQATGAEFQIPVEMIIDFFLVPCGRQCGQLYP